eukprot:CAMPEP_0117614186 /NCGR_PEP_ID=MMETSP0784-20121206/83898_1 /TAXON_ID=39447 /ORGANISM="" /LENGTH=33 /DNA_ID= /DNA_START= /DNA_END= /DNA_ORIENTATION=
MNLAPNSRRNSKRKRGAVSKSNSMRKLQRSGSA